MVDFQPPILMLISNNMLIRENKKFIYTFYMRKKAFPIYQLIIILAGIGIPIFIALRTKFLFPPIHEYIIYLAFALILSHMGMIIGETMISFEIAI